MSPFEASTEPVLAPYPGAPGVLIAHGSSADASADALSAIDQTVLAQLQQLDRDGTRGLLGRVLAAYRASLARLMVQLTRGRHEGNLASVRLAAHTLKSSSASIGALAMSGACAAVEQAIRDSLTDQLPAQLGLLAEEARRADAAVRQLQHTYPPPR